MTNRAEKIIRADDEGRVARCRVCERMVNVTTRGTLFVHGVLPCPGSGSKPLPASGRPEGAS